MAKGVALWHLGEDLFQDNTCSHCTTKVNNGANWTELPLPENFVPPLRCLETTWSCIFLVDSQGKGFYRGRYFLQDWLNNHHSPDTWHPLRVANIQSLCACSNLLVVIGENGKRVVVFSSSSQSSSTSHMSPPSMEPCMSWSLDSVVFVSVATGRGYFLVITTSGEVYGWGTNDYGQLGIGWEISRDQSVHLVCNYFHSLTKIETIPCGMAQKVVCCDKSSAVLLKNGRVIVFGNNLYLQLGTLMCCPIQIPEYIETFTEEYPAVDIAMSGWQLAVLTCRGEIGIYGKEPIHPTNNDEEKESSLGPRQYYTWHNRNVAKSLETAAVYPPLWRLIAGRRYFLLQTPDGIYGCGSGLRDDIWFPCSTQTWQLLWSPPPESSTIQDRQPIIVSGAQQHILIYYSWETK